MRDYIFILGRDPELSMLELVSYFKARHVKHEIKKWQGIVAIISAEPQNFTKMLFDLGGTSKIADIIRDLDKTELYTGKSGKLKYGISRYDKTEISDLEIYLKKRFKQEKLKATYKKSKRKNPYLGPMEVVKGNILEFIVYDGLVAKTLAVSNPIEYKERDTPTKNPISIRLAQILINLTGLKGGTIFDPADSGTIKKEAKLIGFSVSDRADAIVTAPLMSNMIDPFGKTAKTMVLAIPRVRRHKIVDLVPIAQKYGMRLHSEISEINLPITYKAKEGRIERDIWVFKQKL